MWITLLFCELRYCFVNYVTVMWITLLLCELRYCYVNYITVMWITLLLCELRYCYVNYVTVLWITLLLSELRYCFVNYVTVMWITLPFHLVVQLIPAQLHRWLYIKHSKHSLTYIHANISKLLIFSTYIHSLEKKTNLKRDHPLKISSKRRLYKT